MAAPKIGYFEGKVTSFLSAIGNKGVMAPLLGAFSAFVMWGFSYLVRRYPEEATNIAKRISNLYFSAADSWVLFAKGYMEQMTGEFITQDIVDDLIGKPINLTGKEMAQRIGKAFLTPMFNMIMPGTKDWYNYRTERGFPKGTPYTFEKVLNPSDGLLGAERFLGMNLQFQLQAWMLHFIGDTVSFGSMKSLKDLPNAISWSYGIGWL